MSLLSETVTTVVSCQTLTSQSLNADEITAGLVIGDAMSTDLMNVEGTLTVVGNASITGGTLTVQNPVIGTNFDTLNFSINAPPSVKQSINYYSATTIQESKIDAQLDNPSDIEQVYTFGQSIPKRYVAVGRGPSHSLAYSSDGITWTGLGKTTFGYATYGVVWNGKIWVAVGAGTNNTIAYSSDGITWNGLGTSIFSGDGGFGVAWNGKIWVAVGSGTYTIAYSSDGITWTAVVGSTSIFAVVAGGVAWNGTIWVAFGGNTPFSIAYSTDGITWTGVPGSLSLFIYGSAAAWNGKLWVAVGSDGAAAIATSYNGITWTAVPNSLTIFSLVGKSIMWDGTRFLAGGAYSTNQFAYSLDGFNWTIGSGFSTIFQDDVAGIALNIDRPNRIVFPPNRTVAVGIAPNTISYSDDGGKTWTGLGNSIFFDGRGIAWNGKLWVALGAGVTHTLAYSYDGINWTGLGKSIFGIGRGVAWNGTLWVAVGQQTNTIAYSSDGINWTGLGTSIFSDNNGTAIGWNGTLWVAGGGNLFMGAPDTLAYSYDGINWTGLGNSIIDKIVFSVAWNGTLWVACGVGLVNTIAYSYDGINWTGLGTAGGVLVLPKVVTWTGSFWVAGSSEAGVGANTLSYSYDGINWISLGNILSIDIYGVAWNGGKGGVFMNPNSLVLNANGAGLSNRLDVVADGYYNTGFSNMTLTIRT